jgi:hypothetical protein
MPLLLQALRETHDRTGEDALVRLKQGVAVKPYVSTRRRRDLHRRASILVRADAIFFAPAARAFDL